MIDLRRLLCLGLVACSVSVSATSQVTDPLRELAMLRAKLEAVSSPDLSNLEGPVARQLRAARTEMEAVIAEPNATPSRLAAAYGMLGQLYHAYEIFDAALACYRNASLLDPQEFAWMHLQADVSRRQGNLEDAAAQFEAAWALQPYNFPALVYLGEIYLELNRDADAEAAFEEALALSPGSPSTMAGLGHLALRRREFEDAAGYFTHALIYVPDANRLHYSLAMAYRGLGRTEEARHHLELRGTVGLRPPDPLIDGLQQLREGERVRLVRGRLAFASGRFQEAADEFGAAVAADPESVRALVNLGTALSQLGDQESARVQFEKALAIEPLHTTAHFNLGSLLVSQGAAPEAIPHLQETIRNTPYDAVAQLLLAQAFVATGDNEASLAHFEQAAKLDPASEDAVVGGAAALVRLNQYTRSKSVLEAGFKRMPSSGRIAFALARLLAACPDAQVRDGTRALTLAEQVYAAEPSPRHAQTVAQALAELGRCETAAEWQQKVVDAAVADGATDVLDILRADLEMYQGGSPCRAPVR